MKNTSATKKNILLTQRFQNKVLLMHHDISNSYMERDHDIATATMKSNDTLESIRKDSINIDMLQPLDNSGLA